MDGPTRDPGAEADTGPATPKDTARPKGEPLDVLPAPSGESWSGSFRRRTPSEVRREEIRRKVPRGGRRFSRLTLSIIALNILPVAALLGGLLYVGSYERSLIQQELVSLGTQARIFARALGETAIPVPSGAQNDQEIDQRVADWVIKQLVAPTRVRIRVFNHKGALVADTLKLKSAGIRVEKLAPPEEKPGWLSRAVVTAYDWFFDLISSGREEAPIYTEKKVQRATDYVEVKNALAGEASTFIRRSPRGYLVLSYAVPVQRYKRVYGALLVSANSINVDRNVRETRLDIMQIFAVILFATLLLSFYLSRSIARPINRLAAAAEAMRRHQKRSVAIPDFTNRRDEIGDLSGALRDLTNELWHRLDAIERFAADVAHEIKNPLSSVRSAVETAAKVDDPERKKMLMDVIHHDVERLDRLISDISRASRLDAEMSRVEPEPVDLGKLLTTLVDVHQATAEEDAPRMVLRLPDQPLIATAAEDRLVQVFQNVLVNAISFSPPRGEIRITGRREGNQLVIVIEDQGPGIPEGSEESIFNRFYSERPAGEKFGGHSGLGLSISRQIITALGGRIYAENVETGDGSITGARFVIRLRRSR